ncbi:uncharacterized protein EI97DRAFT_94604 [Westerdykella ornata]|uniref:Malate dehydrogenase n=1 Tax=Westerdykella ornata TaxID=318751 RepID=A0A6A6JEA4_WESOR|nr:uncharacterized protein EI97DRAFT_94604 [Westerdykella ornata]KAF2274617.1 hypothetical protein EI97DRAFT_94604 [Westerdykella ornata]
MTFTKIISVLLALAPATILAAPTKTADSISDILARRGLHANVIKILEDGVCDLSNAKMPIAPTPLPEPAPGLQLAHVALGRGTQNYTCKTASPTETPVAVGAKAQLFNVTCESVRSPAVLADTPALALAHAIPQNDVSKRLVSGHHEFTAAGVPLFVLDTEQHKYGFVLTKKAGASDAPANAPKGINGLGSVPWLKLTAVEGDYKEVYRIHTAGGMAPKTCEERQGDFQVEYSTLYYFWK